MSNIENTAPIAEGPDRVTELVNQTAIKQAAAGGKIDLRVLQTELYKIQRRDRLSNLPAIVNRARTIRHRGRPRQLLIGDCRVIDTGRDSSGERLYFELSNGQVVRAGTHFKNPLLQKLVNAEVEKNAARQAA